jgi:hypothetical protein
MDAVTARAKSLLGTTANPEDAGFLLSDGSLLNGRTARGIEHETVGDALPPGTLDPGDPKDGPMRFVQQGHPRPDCPRRPGRRSGRRQAAPRRRQTHG